MCWHCSTFLISLLYKPNKIYFNINIFDIYIYTRRCFRISWIFVQIRLMALKVLIHSVHWRINPPSPLPSPPPPALNLQTVQVPLFRKLPPISRFFLWTLPLPKNLIFQWSPYWNFPSLTPSHVKISHFWFLVMKEKNIFVYKLFFPSNISNFSLFFL